MLDLQQIGLIQVDEIRHNHSFFRNNKSRNQRRLNQNAEKREKKQGEKQPQGSSGVFLPKPNRADIELHRQKQGMIQKRRKEAKKLQPTGKSNHAERKSNKKALSEKQAAEQPSSAEKKRHGHQAWKQRRTEKDRNPGPLRHVKTKGGQGVRSKPSEQCAQNRTGQQKSEKPKTISPIRVKSR
ncbi:MAG: hypothetical protein J5789_04330 [Oscillospiraceae bacterium]|nr:hypothetical protein [Oscillospiraceae bacterium]